MRWLPLCLFVGSGCWAIPELVQVDAGACPASIDNQWPSAAATAAELPEPSGPAGYALGQVPPDFGLVDQNGDVACLRQFQGHYVVLDASAQWCEPCKEVATHVSCVREALGDEVVYITLINEGTDNRGTRIPAVDDDARQWAEAFGLDMGAGTPVVADIGKVYTWGFPGEALPSFLLLDPEQRVIEVAEGSDRGRRMERWLADHLGRSIDHCFVEE